MTNLNLTVFILCQMFRNYIEYTIKEHEILTKIPPVYVYINRIGNIFVFEIKNGYKLELQTRKVRKLFRNTKK